MQLRGYFMDNEIPSHLSLAPLPLGTNLITETGSR